MSEQVKQDERIDPLTLFPEDIRTPVSGLTHLGYISETVSFCGHTFTLETIRPYVKYAIAQALEPYRNTLQEPEVYAALHVGMALTSIDGRTDFCPPTGANLREFVDARLHWITQESGWFQPTINFLYAYYLAMEQKVSQALVELQNLSARSRDTLPPLPDSSKEQAPSEYTTGLGIPHLDTSS